MSSKLKIGIVGLGLIGGSIEKKLQTYSDRYEIKTVSKSQARECQLEDLAQEDIVFICSPQSQVAKVLEQIAAMQARDDGAFSKTIITDVASTKLRIKTKAEALGLQNFIAGHPMAGTEEQGYEASFPELFENAKWVLERSEANLVKVIEDLGAKLEYLDPELHDQAVAVTSHLPLVLSLALASLGKSFNAAQKTIGPGYKGMVRLAKGNVDMGQEIINFNRKNIKSFWQDFKAEVDALLEANDEDLNEELQDLKQKVLAELC